MNAENKFYDGFTEMKLTAKEPQKPKSKTFTVYLYRSPDCIRKWLAYLRPSDDATFVVQVKAVSGAKAKNAAITSANNGFVGVKIVGRNLDDKLWGINNFPELKEFANG